MRSSAAAERLLGHSITTSGCPNSTGDPSSTKMPVTFPARGATISLKVRIASMSRSVSPASTVEPISTNGCASLQAAVPAL